MFNVLLRLVTVDVVASLPFVRLATSIVTCTLVCEGLSMGTETGMVCMAVAGATIITRALGASSGGDPT